MTSEQKKLKRSKIRYAEYYDLQTTLDGLYADSTQNKIFSNLMEIITSTENIKMAYRTIKGNTGSNTAGVDKRSIQDLSRLREDDYVALIQKQFMSYHPASHPWPILGQTESQLLCAALEAVLEVSKRVKDGEKLRLGFREGPAYDRSVPLLTPSEGGFVWSLHPLPPRWPVRHIEPVLSDELLLARLKKAKKRGGTWVCDVVLMPQPFMDDNASAPVFPYTLLTAICEPALVLSTEVVSNYESESEALLRALGNRMLEHGIPKEIRVVDERTYAFLKNLAALLKIRLTLQEKNDLLDEIEMDFLAYVSSQTADTVEIDAADFAEMILTLDDDTLLTMPNELWGQLCSLEQQGMLDEAVARQLRALSKRKM